MAAAEARVAEEREQSKALKVGAPRRRSSLKDARTARRRSGREPRAAAKGGKVKLSVATNNENESLQKAFEAQAELKTRLEAAEGGQGGKGADEGG